MMQQVAEWLDALESADIITQIAADAPTELLRPPREDQRNVPAD